MALADALRTFMYVSLWGKPVISVARGLNGLIKSIFRAGEQGFAYDPNDLTTLYQDAAGTIPVTAAGQPVGLMLDKSGRGNHARQTTSASRPILRRNATTGAYYLEFDGTDDFLVTNSIDFTATDEITVIAALSKTATPNRFYSIFELSAAASKYDSTAGSFNLAVFNTSLDGFIYRSHGSVLTNDTAAKITTGYAANIPAVLTCKSKIGTDLSSIYEAIGKVSAAASLDQGLGKYANLPLYIGRQGGVGTTAFPGHIYSLIGIGRLTTDSETTSLEKSIAKNVGVTI